jgi:Hypothetical glycosyl hydrolase family 15/Dockerin type I domain
MTRPPFASRRLVRKPGSRTNGDPCRARLQVERLEDRLAPAYFPSTTSGIHILEDQYPANLSTKMVQFLATHTDGTQKQLLQTVNQYRAINPNFTVLHYQLATGNSAWQYIINNQWTADFNYVNQQENWFAHQTYSGEPQSAADLASGRILGNNNDWYQADIANPAWQQYTLNQVLQNIAATGSNGWFADSFNYGIGGAAYNNPIPTRYQGTNAANSAVWPGGVTWTTQLGNWARTVQTAFDQYNAANGTNYKFIPNFVGLDTSWEPNWYSNANGVPIMDGAFLEGFAYYKDIPTWTLSMNRALAFTRNDKIIIMQPYPTASPDTASGQQQVDFLLGTYLLLKGDHTYLNIVYGSHPQYLPEYQLNIGAPTTPLPSNVSGYLWNNVYRRDFQNGFVLVNPGGTARTLNLGGTYRRAVASGGGFLTDTQIDASGNYIGGSLTYQNVSSLTLAGASAAIFLNPIPATVANVAIDAGTAQRSMVRSVTVSFDRVVNLGSTPAAAFQLTRTGPGQTGNVTLAVDLTGSTATQTIARLTFTGALTEGPKSLVDGNYTLTVFGAQVQGGLQGGDSTTSLYRLYGDLNGDKTINLVDLTAFRNAFGTGVVDDAFVPFLDFNGDGAINITDLTQFRNRFGVILP